MVNILFHVHMATKKQSENLALNLHMLAKKQNELNIIIFVSEIQFNNLDGRFRSRGKI